MRIPAVIGSSRILMLLGILWLAVVLLFAMFKPAMFNGATVTTILQFSTILALVALGQGLIVLAGGAGIDLSVGGTVSLSATLCMLAVKFGMPVFAIPVFCLVIGAALGALNGLLVTRLSILPLIATLGTLFVYSGLAVALTGGAAQSGVPAWLLAWGRGVFFGVPVPFLTTVIPVFVFGAVTLLRTAWGAWIFAMGYNERSARLVGIPVDRVRLLIYALSGALAGLAGLISIAWLGSARPNIGQNLELESLTAVMLGGIAITGGVGGVGGILAAVVLLITLKTGLLQLNVNTVWQVGIVGALLIAVLLIDRISKHWR
ncbi:MAG: sugar ABC transporter permease [Rhizobium sp. 60-20]|nr:ABC transporter permease [Rhizobium tropici]OJY79155.1 MAG: sugar ABC transporter permease [Rhizobium sp. 60-20]RKD67659.1 ribose transport system permease protein/rhamnose transport system permease protein [Rhizobium sp. WW_1]